MAKEYDIIVVGSGAGLNIVNQARERGWKVALFENGPIGGTCLNRGCIPSKIWTSVADAIRSAEDAAGMGVGTSIDYVDFSLLRSRLRRIVDDDSKSIEKALGKDPDIDLVRRSAEFVGHKTLQGGMKKASSERIVIASGVRTRVPDVKGLEKAGYLRSEDVFMMKEPPRSLAILGGGYKAAEFAHFFSAIGVDVTVIGRNARFLPSEDPDAAETVLSRLSERADFFLGYEVEEVQKANGRKRLTLSSEQDGATVEADEILLCTGVVSNSDLLKPELSGIQTDPAGYFIVDKRMRTNVDGVYAIGDALGRNMFRHNANHQSMVAWQNIVGKEVRADEHAIPHAVFSWPQVASVGMTEAEAKSRGFDVLVGHHRYSDTGKGYAIRSEEGFVKVVVDGKSKSILGATVCGPEASSLLQTVVVMMNGDDGSPRPLIRSQVTHPTLAEVLERAFRGLHHH